MHLFSCRQIINATSMSSIYFNINTQIDLKTGDKNKNKTCHYSLSRQDVDSRSSSKSSDAKNTEKWGRFVLM